MMPEGLFWLLVVILGLCLGSFTTCVMYRLPRRISLWKKEDGSHRSFCPSCRTPLRAVDLVPVFSWLVQKGRCRYCGTKISIFYPLIELAVMACVAMLAWFLGFSVWFFVAAFAVPFVFGLLACLQKLNQR